MPKSYMLCLAEGWMWLKRQLLVTVLPIFLSSWQNSHRSEVSSQMARTIKMCFRTGWSKWIAEVPEQAVLRLTKGLQRAVLVHTFPEKRSKEVKMIFISIQIHFKTQLKSDPVQDGLCATCSRQIPKQPLLQWCAQTELWPKQPNFSA